MKSTGIKVTTEELEQVKTAQSCSGMWLSGGIPLGDPQQVVTDLARKYNAPIRRWLKHSGRNLLPAMSDSETAARVKNSQSKSFRKLNPHLFQARPPFASDSAPTILNHGHEDDEEHDHIEALTAARKPRPTTDEEKLNKLEKAFLAYLRAINPPYIGIQNVTLKLAFDCRFTPDFTYVDNNGLLWFVDTKGPHQWEDSLIKIKTAARMFPWAHFALAKKGKGQAPWDITVIKT